MFENFYVSGALDIIQENFEISISNEVRYTFCNIKLISLFENIEKFITLRDNKNESIFENVKGITYEDFYEILDNKEFYHDVIERSFIKCYEIFEKTIEEIITYIHYKKLRIVLNKNNTITCDKLKCNNIESLVEELINKNVGSIVYNNGIKHMIAFISRYSKGNLNKDFIDSVFILSKIRNAFVHDNGLVDNRIILLMDGLFDIQCDKVPETDKVKFVLDLNNIIESNEMYTKVISCIINDMKEQFETKNS